MTSLKGWYLWYELMTDDVEAAKAFYGEQFGWRARRWSGNGSSYTEFLVGERPVAGLTKLTPEAVRVKATPQWVGFVGTPDVDATVRQASALGAKVLTAPADSKRLGRWCLIQDPQGGVQGLLTPGDATGSVPVPRPGDFSWHELIATDAAAACRYYTELYGWQQTQTMDMGPAGLYHLYMANSAQGGGVFNRPPDSSDPVHWLYYVCVDDLEAAMARTLRLGGKVERGPEEVPGGDRVAQCLDPRGAPFALHWKTPSLRWDK